MDFDRVGDLGGAELFQFGRTGFQALSGAC